MNSAYLPFGAFGAHYHHWMFGQFVRWRFRGLGALRQERKDFLAMLLMGGEL
jgi:hypothetical protein